MKHSTVTAAFRADTVPAFSTAQLLSKEGASDKHHKWEWSRRPIVSYTGSRLVSCHSVVGMTTASSTPDPTPSAPSGWPHCKGPQRCRTPTSQTPPLPLISRPLLSALYMGKSYIAVLVFGKSILRQKIDPLRSYV